MDKKKIFLLFKPLNLSHSIISFKYLFKYLFTLFLRLFMIFIYNKYLKSNFI